MRFPKFADIAIAHRRIEKFIHRTPVLSNATINGICGAEIYFKCENFQKVGAFKFRGACNAVFALSNEIARNGVGTHSSGNHAQALALAAKLRGVPAYIVMPENSPNVKIDAVRAYGADITFCPATLQDRESTMEKVIERTACHFIHPYTNYNVISGQGTAAKELIEDTPELDYILVPVGGGGLLGGTLLASAFLSPFTKVVACEPDGADDAFRSWAAGEIIPSILPNTIGDGLLTSLGEINFEIMKKYLNQVITADDTQAIEALTLIWERMKIIIEPSSAFPLAVVMNNLDMFAGKKIGIILSGGNIDIKKVVAMM